MRYLRIKKYAKHNKKLILCSKVLLTCYILIFTLSYLNSNTTAYFSDSNADSFTIQAGNWFDNSELMFVQSNTENLRGCPPTEISAEIKNQGFTMIGPAKYEVFYDEEGNPKNNGGKISDGEIKPIKQNETITLSFPGELEGAFIFKVYQRDGYEGENGVIWSHKIMVKCQDKNDNEQKESKEEQKIKTEGKDESQEQPDTEPATDKNEEEVKDEESQEKAEEPVKEEPEQPKEEKQPEEPVTPPAPEEPQVPVEEPKAKAAETPTIPDPDKKDEKQTEEG
ncbi:amyloid fiber anchoring/assembly protein TapA [Rossellomorea vietnamensis]|uniref:Amyloid fiber anchoring/assembly protein TapA n=1 Tax=Rossellomorea vietnamensis TaxID=218284 RepID=A0A5D4NU46_9BACI|nr:amyloid fiber anchoring/assembly protein TapA [Rossellomorea vietnamensis]TYS17863.1 amyloid fiber anchoring/assembly protein TapA [Rossellomorea vietnamensis]